MVASLDGFIAKKDNSVSWLQSRDTYEKGTTLSEEDVVKTLAGIDCYLMGSRTYEHALKLGWPYGAVPVVVLTHRNLTADRRNVTFFSGDLNKLINERLKLNYRSIWMVGGSKLTKEFIRLDLANEIIISIMPILLGNGTLFFDYINQERQLHLIDVTAYDDGMIELRYEIRI